MYKITCTLCAIAFSFLALNAQQIDSKRIKNDVKYLASDKLQGRGTGSKGEAKAAAYIANEFKKLKLQPKGTSGYYQTFTFRKNTNPHDTSTTNIPERTGMNVMSFLDNGAATTVVIGAHYDHLGMGHDHNSMDANPEDKIHNGADDNASGTSGVLELARYFSSNNRKEAFNFLFICFSGEELGLIGSKKFCEKPTINLATVNYMINMDMIGRLNDSTKTLLVYGVGTSPTWVPLIDGLTTDFKIKKDSAGIGPSDQTSFYLKDIPVLHFFSGQHRDYHRPSDDIETLNYEGEKKILEYVIQVIEQTEPMPRLVFQKTKSSLSDTPKMKVTMGIMPDYAFEGKGVRVDGVTDGRPAAKAGVKAGDVIVLLGDVKITTMMDYMTALAKYKKGETVPLHVMRGQEEVKLTVTF